ncbi:pseudouridine synthase [Flavobacterium sp.]|uniref:RluA family pseudouridine synthase n=1 Tax=Flavobacterium sp. TaxID=239 RepID=UPI0035AF834A
MAKKIKHFISFKTSIEGISLPEKFTFPFYYEPHPLSIIAANELQEYLTNQNEWQHNFGLDDSMDGMIIGKMFGILVVQNDENEIGYLAAFSGKLADKNLHQRFVPPVFDMLDENGYFKKEEIILNNLNADIEKLESDLAYQDLKNKHKILEKKAFETIEAKKLEIKDRKKKRDFIRKDAAIRRLELDLKIIEDFKRESLKDKSDLKKLTENWNIQLNLSQKSIDEFENIIIQLKEERKAKSAALQKRLHDEYAFLNARGEIKNLHDIFSATKQQKPPAAAGECAAPKLLQYAFKNNLKPIAMAEFWWGKSPKSEIRKHQHFYPACRGKCEPILEHMLKDLTVDDNPMLVNPAENKDISIVYDDEYLCIVNKPAEFLSVPGIAIQDSIYTRIKEKYPEISGPIIVHRLDMSTSGLLLIAKNKRVHQKLQKQFIDKTISKRYVALLEGNVKTDEGIIDLPLRVDLEDRPRQMVCYEYGKNAKTKYKVVERKNNTTKIHFWPITGRTHQLRVHASHILGLNAPIVGDDLYGKKSDRLYLHAESISFEHPETKKIMTIEALSDF